MGQVHANKLELNDALPNKSKQFIIWNMKCSDLMFDVLSFIKIGSFIPFYPLGQESLLE